MYRVECAWVVMDNQCSDDPLTLCLILFLGRHSVSVVGMGVEKRSTTRVTLRCKRKFHPMLRDRWLLETFNDI
ncbi:hypothetical protein F4009_04260 [Candidatus Poribacteria bacterium]|nr:hypothetical protein [Candidatus Poribacteria bacterium]MYH79979.1 hypothetical protein [Candidatus Poribacteria bacterium]MYK93205.1 hypothetical protein [Candidatus Poribacteria bacterium]